MAEPGGVDYAAALREVGFESEWVARGVRRVERETREGTYLGFRTMVNQLRISGGHTMMREHHVEPVIRRVEAQEAATRLAERGARAALRSAASQAEADEHGRARARSLREQSLDLQALLSETTDDELEARVPMRPHIAEAWRRLFPVERERRSIEQSTEQSSAAKVVGASRLTVEARRITGD